MHVLRRTHLVGLASVALAALAAAVPAQAKAVTWNHSTGSPSGILGEFGTNLAIHGSLFWYPSGEILTVDDWFSDGNYVRAEISYPDPNTPSHHLASVTDTNGAKKGSGILNLSLPERTPVKLRLCIDGAGCSPWYDDRA